MAPLPTGPRSTTVPVTSAHSVVDALPVQAVHFAARAGAPRNRAAWKDRAGARFSAPRVPKFAQHRQPISAALARAQTAAFQSALPARAAAGAAQHACAAAAPASA